MKPDNFPALGAPAAPFGDAHPARVSVLPARGLISREAAWKADTQRHLASMVIRPGKGMPVLDEGGSYNLSRGSARPSLDHFSTRPAQPTKLAVRNGKTTAGRVDSLRARPGLAAPQVSRGNLGGPTDFRCVCCAPSPAYAPSCGSSRQRRTIAGRGRVGVIQDLIAILEATDQV